MEMDIDLNCIDEGEGFGEMHEVLSQMSETSVSQKSKKARPARDPETNLTWDAVRKRRLTERFNEMLSDRGFAYRVDSVERLTNIQTANLVHRGQKYIDMLGVSEDVMSHIFEHRVENKRCLKRGVDLDNDHERFLQELDSLVKPRNKFELQFNPDPNAEEQKERMVPLRLKKEYDEDTDEIIWVKVEAPKKPPGPVDHYEETSRVLRATEDWFSNLLGDLEEYQKEAQMALQELGNHPSYFFADGEEQHDSSARCRPFKSSKQRKLGPKSSGDCSPAPVRRVYEFDCLGDMPQPMEQETCARCRPIGFSKEQVIREVEATNMDFNCNAMRKIGYVPKTLDDQIGECIEAMALQFDVDVDKPVKKRVSGVKPIKFDPPLVFAKSTLKRKK